MFIAWIRSVVERIGCFINSKDNIGILFFYLQNVDQAKCVGTYHGYERFFSVRFKKNVKYCPETAIFLIPYKKSFLPKTSLPLFKKLLKIFFTTRNFPTVHCRPIAIDESLDILQS